MKNERHVFRNLEILHEVVVNKKSIKNIASEFDISSAYAGEVVHRTARKLYRHHHPDGKVNGYGTLKTMRANAEWWLKVIDERVISERQKRAKSLALEDAFQAVLSEISRLPDKMLSPDESTEAILIWADARDEAIKTAQGNIDTFNLNAPFREHNIELFNYEINQIIISAFLYHYGLLKERPNPLSKQSWEMMPLFEMILITSGEEEANEEIAQAI